MVPSHRACGFAAGAALFSAYRWDLSKDWFLHATPGGMRDKVMAGGPRPTLQRKYEREPGWFPLIARAVTPQALLSFRHIDGIYLRIGFSTPRPVG
jgi:hypothetical protein